MGILRYVKLDLRQVVALLVLTLVGAATELGLPTLLAIMIDDGIATEAHGVIASVAAAMVALALAGFVSSLVATAISARISTTLAADLRSKVFRKVQSFSSADMDRFGTASLVTRTTSDVTNVQFFVMMLMQMGVMSPLMLVAGLVLSSATGGRLSMVLLVSVPIVLVLAALIMPVVSRLSRRMRRRLDDLNRVFLETLEGVRPIRAFRREDYEMQRFGEANDAHASVAIAQGTLIALIMPLVGLIFGFTTTTVLWFGAGYVAAGSMEVGAQLATIARRASVASGTVRPITMTVINLGYALSTALGSLFALQGRMTVGDVQAMLQYSHQFSQPFTQLAAMAGGLAAAMAAAERIFDLLDAPEQESDPTSAVQPSSHDGCVSFEHVRFGYDPNDTLMHDVSFTVEPGQKVAIVGHTGAGKTTLVNILMRFYEVDGGSIVVDGVPTRNMTRDELRSRFGMVLQDTWLFQGTVRENLAYGRDGASDSDIVRAAKAASVDSVIRTMPDGYDTMLVSGASNVSQGERQLLTIARALVADPEIMILDEATSNVDARTERMIQEAMSSLLKGRTSFVVAHRLSTIRDADKILYMEHGDILEAGTHDELMARGGRYAALYNAQCG